MTARILGALLLLALPLLAVPAAADTPYTVTITIEGIKGGPAADAVQSASQLVSLKDRLPPSSTALRRRAQDDMPRLVAAMQAQGYWHAAAAFTINATATPASVAVRITPGPLYHLGTISFVPASGSLVPLIDKLNGGRAVGLVPGAPALSAPVDAANPQIVALYAHNGYPLASITDRHVVVDVATHVMSVTYTIDPGREAHFGATTIQGLRNVNQDFVTRRIAWKEGDLYDQNLVDATQRELARSGLFSEVRITHAAGLSPDGRLPITITLIEGPRRSIGAGAGYNTNFGLGARAFWEHHNLFGEGEDLNLQAGAAQRQLGLFASFRRPNFLVNKEDLVINAERLDETTDAYRSRRTYGSVGVEELQWQPYTFGAGVSIERAYLTVSEPNRDENYLLLGVPLYVRRDTTDDPLNPTMGTRGTITFTPYHSLLNDRLNFVSSRIEERGYQRIGPTDRYVLAGYAALGSVDGVGLAGLPVDKRLYAGGAGSVRGYGYQRAGPLDSDGLPEGGRSSIELGGEFRYRITETIGIVPFVDAGNVFATELPNKSDLFYSAGIGLRYYTVVGPLRLDLAFPIEKRSSDSPIQVYISIGQAF